MFQDSEFDQPINKWDTSNVEHMSYMFSESKFNQPISEWNTSKVENMNGMFELLMNIKKESLTYDAPVVDAELKEDIQQCLISDLFLYNVNHLSSLGITHIKQLTSMTELDLVKLEGVGRTRVAKIKSWLSKYGLRLKPISI